MTEITKEIKTLEFNKNDHTTSTNVWDTVKMMHVHHTKCEQTNIWERSHCSNHGCPRALEQNEEITPKMNRWQKVIKIKAQKTIQRINQINSWFFQKINV